MVRFILGQVILHVLRRDPLLKGWYLRIKKRRGAKIAKVAAMRRLATILWHMVKHRQPYRIGDMMHTTATPEACPRMVKIISRDGSADAACTCRWPRPGDFGRSLRS